MKNAKVTSIAHGGVSDIVRYSVATSWILSTNLWIRLSFVDPFVDTRVLWIFLWICRTPHMDVSVNFVDISWKLKVRTIIGRKFK